jgi:lysophospholipase
VSARPPPDGGTFATFRADDGADLRYAFWPRPDARGTVILLGGFTEFIEKHYESTQDLLDRGFAVATMDWRCQGLSHRPLANRQKIHVADFARYVKDLSRFRDQVVEPVRSGPVVVLAHSMGGHHALRFLHDRPDAASCAVLSAPMIDIHAPDALRPLAEAMFFGATRLGLATCYAPGSRDYGPWKKRFEGNRLTSDPERFRQMHAEIDADPRLACGGATFGWVEAALQSISLMRQADYLAGFRTPLCLVQAGCDRIVDNRAQDRFAAAVPSAELHRIEDARHELLRERDDLRDRFWGFFDGFVARHCPA